MRNLTFRLWHEAEKRMVYKGALTFDLSDSAWLWEGRYGSFHSHFGKLMQGTGIEISTKKGIKEIFEGDILKVAKTDIVTVVWDKQIGGFNTEPRIEYADWGWRESVTDHTDRIEIIGNIYDNPNLL